MLTAIVVFVIDGVRVAVLALPASDARRDGLRKEAVALAESALSARWLLIERAGSSIQPPLLDILIAWITLIFISFGYNAPRNATVGSALLLGAAAIAACVFLINEMDTPFGGLIRISSAPMRNALAQMTPAMAGG